MNLKSNKAITLVALIITIIILLVLAGVTLSMVLGENGLINKAQSSVDKYQEIASNEQIKLNEMEDYLTKMPVRIISYNGITIKVGEIATPELILEGGEYNNITFESSNPDIAIVDSDTGEMKGVKEGNTTITVTVTSYNGTIARQSCEVIVKDYLIGAEITVSGIEFYVIEDTGDKLKLLTKSQISGITNWSNAMSIATNFGANLGASGRLITIDEVRSLPNHVIKGGVTAGWWTQSWYNTAQSWMYYVSAGGSVSYLWTGNNAATRPVILIEKSKI